MIAEVVINRSNLHLDKTFDYIVDDNVTIGSRVLVNFANSILIGIVVNLKETSEFEKLKGAQFLDSPLDEKKIELMKFMVSRYHLRMIDVLKLFIPKKMREQAEPERGKIYFQLSDISDEELAEKVKSEKQMNCVEYLKKYHGEYGTILCERFDRGVVSALLSKGVLLKSSRYQNTNQIKALDIKDKDITLTPDQQKVVDEILSGDGKYLLKGVTGSGKTEVYKKVIKEMIKQGKTAIMLVPEISLTPQMLGNFRNDFGEEVAVLHSKLNDTERYNEWKKIKEGEAKVVIGPRSAIFAPCKDLGIVIIDESHDGSYISETNPRYDTKEVAEFLCEQLNCKFVMGSATPDIESYYKAKEGKYKLLKLDNRISQHEMHDIEIVDTRSQNLHSQVFSNELLEAIQTALEKKEQVMILLNRRGFFPHTICNDCGEVVKCLNCDIGLTYHKKENIMMCHYCGTKYHVVNKCPKCGSYRLKPSSYGTEKLEHLLQEIFREYDPKVIRMDVDTVTAKEGYYHILKEFQDGKVDILVGTQMIAKGHDFGNVTVVGILEMDRQLFRCDYMSAEKTFQLATQVSGRAGRADKKGRVILQTFCPFHYAYHFIHKSDYEGFYEKELNVRAGTKFPPFAKILRIMFVGKEHENIREAMKPIYLEIKELQKTYGEFIHFKASESVLARANSSLRYNVIVRMENAQFDKILDEIYNIIDKYPSDEVSIFVEINPHDIA